LNHELALRCKIRRGVRLLAACRCHKSRENQILRKPSHPEE